MQHIPGTRLVSFCTAFLALLLVSNGAWGAPSEGFDKVIPLHDPATEVALKIQLIEGATRTIDLIMYDQWGDDVIGRQLLQALRAAANRRVKIRMIKSYFAAYHSDPKGVARLLLNDDTLAVRPELVTYGGWGG